MSNLRNDQAQNPGPPWTRPTNAPGQQMTRPGDMGNIMGNLLEMEVFNGENRRITWGISLKMGKIMIESCKIGI